MQEQKKIVLIGYMASGKTVIGKQLAVKLKIPFIDLDDYIAEKEQLSIPEIFKKRGELHFRKLEFKYLKELLDKKENFVLSVGGGTPTVSEVIELINKKALSVYLQASVQTLYDRLVISDTVKRPLLTQISTDFLKDYIVMHLLKRNVFYNQADKIVTVDGLSIEEIVTKIISKTVYSK
jgi:shikimate kinase